METLNNGEPGLSIRNKINGNFLELLNRSGLIAGSFTSALPTGTIATDKVYLYAGTNATLVDGITWYNGDSALYNGSSWSRIPFQSLANYYTKLEFDTILKNKGKNRFNSADADIKLGYFLSVANALSTNAGYNTTGYMAVTPGENIVCSISTKTLKITLRTVVFYNSSKTLIAGGVENVTSCVIPVNVAYIRCSIATGIISTALFPTIQFENSIHPTDYETYYQSVFDPKLRHNIASINYDAVDQFESINMLDVSKIIGGKFVDLSGIENIHDSYNAAGELIKVDVGKRVIAVNSTTFQPMTFRFITCYDSNFAAMPGSGVQSVNYFDVPTGVAYIRPTFFVSEGTSIMLQYGYVPSVFHSKHKTILPNYLPSKKTVLAGKTVLVYGDSKVSDNQYLNVMSALTGIDRFFNMAITGANIIGFSTRNESTNKYDWRTSYPNSGTDTYNDRLLIPQIDHTPNTLRHKYNIISTPFLQADARYMLKPDIVIIDIGFNDWKNAMEKTYETYADVIDLTYNQLLDRASDAGVLTVKVLTYLRLALEKLNAEITETLDGYTYGIDCRLSKFVFVTPIQCANPFTYIDGGTSNHTKSLLEFGDYLNDLLSDYSISRIDGYRDGGISRRYESVGVAGKFLTDGIHLNSLGAIKVGRAFAAKLASMLR